MNKPKKPVRDPLKQMTQSAYRRAFGQPSAEFHDRVQDTLFLIEEKEDAPVKKKMTFSMAFALVLCVCLATAAFAGSLLPSNLPDNTLDPLSKSQNTPDPQLTPMPMASDPLYYRSGDMGFYHKLFKCFGGEQYILTTQEDIDRLNLTACPYCVFDTVYCMEGSVLYHKTADCTAFGEHNLAATMFDAAKSEGKAACPICIASSCIFWQEGDEYTTYHLRVCSEMDKIADHSAAVQGTVAEARACGRELCETCKSSAVLYSPNQPYMSHIDAECMNEENAEWIPLDSALSIDASGCALCMENLYFCTPWNGFYHRYHDCSAINGSSLMLLSEEDAVSSGRTLCPDCGEDPSLLAPTCTPMPAETAPQFTIPNKVLPTPMPTATPIASEPRTVYFVENGGIHYHTDYACSGMKNPQMGSVAQALNLGKTACPVCMDVSPTPMPMKDSELVYMTDYNGIYYHYDENCMNMVGAYYTTFESMRNGDNRPPCPLCVVNSAVREDPQFVWSAQGDVYYHIDNSCGSSGKFRVMLAVAQNRGQLPCPTCLSDHAENEYYYRTDGVFFHADRNCRITENCELLSGTLMQMQTLGRTPCPNCYEPSSADITYYAAPAAHSYHTQFSCAVAASSQEGYPLPADKSESAITFADIFEPSGKYYAHKLEACPDCVLSEPAVSSAADRIAADVRVPLMQNEVMTAPSTPRAVTINALDFEAGSAGTCSDLAVTIDCDALTVHSAIMLHSRGALYTEFEFTLHDPSIHPASLRFIPFCEEHGLLGCLWANVQEIRYDNGETGYLLCQMMSSPSLDYAADCIIIYSGDVKIAELR